MAISDGPRPGRTRLCRPSRGAVGGSLAALGVLAVAVAAVAVYALREGPGWYVRMRYPLAYETDRARPRRELRPRPGAARRRHLRGVEVRPDVVSSAGAVGLMQLLPETAQGIADRTGGGGVRGRDLLDPEINVRYGAWYLDHLRDKVRRPPVRDELALAAYNAGRGKVDEWVADTRRRASRWRSPFPETRALRRGASRRRAASTGGLSTSGRARASRKPGREVRARPRLRAWDTLPPQPRAMRRRGDQPQAIAELVGGRQRGPRYQTLLGVTGTGKTFTMANVIAAVEKPDARHRPQQDAGGAALRRVPRVLPGQRGRVLRLLLRLLPARGLHPARDTYIEKDASINDDIDRLRHAATSSLLRARRRDHRRLGVVHLRPGLARGVPGAVAHRRAGRRSRRDEPAAGAGRHPVRAQRDRARPRHASGRAATSSRSSPRTGDAPCASRCSATRSSRSRSSTRSPARCSRARTSSSIYPAKHFVTTPPTHRARRGGDPRRSSTSRSRAFEGEGKLLEAAAPALAHRVRHGDAARARLLQRHRELLAPSSRARAGLSRRSRCSTTSRATSCVIVDESHSTVPQIGGMYEGDRSRKEHARATTASGCRSALDNRPLRFDEFEAVPQAVFVSATPGPYELHEVGARWSSRSSARPGSSIPRSRCGPTRHQIDDLLDEIRRARRPASACWSRR